MYPSYAESLRSVDKLADTHVLDKIAREVTHTHRPWTAIEPRREGEKQVAKRSASSCCDHVIMPGNLVLSDPPQNTSHFHQWLYQEYTPLLRDVGEIRLLILKGNIIALSVVTQPGEDNGWVSYELTHPPSLEDWHDP
jgi:hypothetical protein